MIVDTSAVVALVQGERPHATLVAAALAGAHSPVMSAPTVAECLIVLTARHTAPLRARSSNDFAAKSA